MNLDIRISRAIVRAVSHYSVTRHSRWVRCMARARLKQVRLRRRSIG